MGMHVQKNVKLKYDRLWKGTEKSTHKLVEQARYISASEGVLITKNELANGHLYAGISDGY